MPNTTVKAKASLPIGLDDVHIALLQSDVKGSATSYDTPIFLSRSIKATLTPTTVSGLLESDDAVEIEENEITGYTVSIEASQLNDENRAIIFGHKIDEDGGIIVSSNDVPPTLALLFRSKLSDKQNYKYVALYKGSFKKNGEEYETEKRDSKTYKTETIEGTFYKRESDGVIKYDLRTDNPNAKAEKISAWFTEVQQPADVQQPVNTNNSENTSEES